MAFNINELKETLELNRSEILHNHSLTNEYMIDDIMRELGYNKRRNKDVKRLLDKPIDWEVLSTGSPRLAVKVFALGDSINDDELQESMNYCKDKPFSIFIVTNGEAMTICRYNKVKREYTEVCDISLMEELNDVKTNVLDAISNDGFNLEIIDNIISEREVSPEKVKDVIKNNLGMLASYVATWLGDSSNSKIEQCKVVIDKLFFSENNSNNEQADVTEYITKIDELQSTINELQDEIKSLQDTKSTEVEEVDVTEYTNKIAELQNTISEYETKINELENSEEQSEEVDNLQKTIDELKNEIIAKDNEIESLKNSSNTTVSNDSDMRSEIEAYREKIQELTNKVAESDETVDTLRSELKKAQSELENMSGSDKKKALELLNVIEDSEELSRSYVAVVNTELMQYDDLPTFVGRALQKLYEIKNYEASQFIFNGDIFKLVQPAQRNDLIMNNKAYDVMIGNTHEDEVLNKLRIVYSHFSDIVFECKKIGTLDNSKEQSKETEDNSNNSIEESVDFGSETQDRVDDDQVEFGDNTEDTIQNTENDSDGSFNSNDSLDSGESFDSFDKDIFGSVDENSFDEAEAFGENVNNSEESNFSSDNVSGFGDGVSLSKEDNNNFNDFDSTDDTFGNTDDTFGNTDDTFGRTDDAFGNFESLDSTAQATEASYSGLICSQLLQIDDLLWGDAQVELNTIKYIGSSSMNFNINMNCDKISNEQLFCKGLDAVLALAMSMGNIGILSKLRQTDLSQVNNFIKLFTEEYSNYPRINGTRYVVAGIESVKQVASLLVDLCNTLGIDGNDIFLYFDAVTNSEQLMNDWGYAEEAIQLREYTDMQVDDVADGIAVLKGGVFNNIIVTKNSLQAHKAIIKNTLAVKTNYLAKVLNNENDFVDIIKAIIAEAMMNGQYPNINGIGNVIGEQYKLVSNNPTEVSEHCAKIDINGNELYVSIVDNWQMPLSIIKTHTALLANTSIAVKLSINTQALNFYLTEFDVAEPSLSLAVTSFCNYMKSCVKQ